MDVFKLAFETTIVGLLTCLWLGVAIYLLSYDSAGNFFGAILRAFGRKNEIPALVRDNQTLIGVGVLILAYCLGSAVLPVSEQLVNDEHWPLNEKAIRCQTLTKQEEQLESVGYTSLPKYISLKGLQLQHCSYWAPIVDKGLTAGQRVWRLLRLWAGFTLEEDDHDDEGKRKQILTLFQQQESTILNQGSDKTESLRQLREKIVVLRGAVFSGFMLFLICLFGYVARVNGHRAHWKRTIWGGLLGLSFTVFALLNGYGDLKKWDVFDIPVLELLLGVVTIYGGILATKKLEAPFLKKRLLFFVALFVALAYGAWMSSEVTYDQQVISSIAVPRTEAGP